MAMTIEDMIKPNSDQLNADDLIGGPTTVEITGLAEGKSDKQPIAVKIKGAREFKPYYPCLSMRRVMFAVFGGSGKDWVGQSMTLFCETSVKFGPSTVGGIRISHVSGITEPTTLMLTTTRGKRAPYTVKPLAVAS